MISSFVSSYSFKKLFIKINSSWLIFESIKALEIKTSMLLSLDLANNTILSYFFFFLLIIDWCFLILANIAEVLNHIADIVIPMGIPHKEAEEEMEIHPLIAEVKMTKSSV